MKNGVDCVHVKTQLSKDFYDPEPSPTDIYTGFWNPWIATLPRHFTVPGVDRRIQDRDRARIRGLCPSCDANAYLAIGEGNGAAGISDTTREDRLAMAAHRHYCTQQYTTANGAYVCKCKEYNGAWAPGGAHNLHF